MKIKFEMTMKVATELLTYCHLHGADEFHLDIKIENESAAYVINASRINLTEAELERLTKLLNAPRQRDIEREYWELMGESEDFCELTLIGMLSDEATVHLEDGVLTIKLFREA